MCRKNTGLVSTPSGCVQPPTVRRMRMGLHKRNGSCPTSIDQYLLEFDIASLRIGPTSVGDSFLIFKNILERIVWVIPI